MPALDSRPDSAVRRIVLDVDGAREVGPTESAGLVRECLALTYRRLDASCWRALEALASTDAVEAGAQTLAQAVRRERGKFFSRFRSEFDQIFATRREGKPRARLTSQRTTATLALVDDRDHAQQMELKSAVQAMRSAVREQGFGFAFDLRTRMML